MNSVELSATVHRIFPLLLSLMLSGIFMITLTVVKIMNALTKRVHKML